MFSLFSINSIKSFQTVQKLYLVKFSMQNQPTKLHNKAFIFKENSPVFLNGKSSVYLMGICCIGGWGILYGCDPTVPAGRDSPDELFTTPLRFLNVDGEPDDRPFTEAACFLFIRKLCGRDFVVLVFILKKK